MGLAESLTDMVQNPDTYRRTGFCAVARALKALPDDDGQALARALVAKSDDGTFLVPHTVIAKAVSEDKKLAKQGVRLSNKAVGIHRRGDCSCVS